MSLKILRDESRFRFDLVNGPIVRATVIRLGDQEHILMLNMHHIATDGYSRSALYRDLTALYDAYGKGLPSPLTPLHIQYADYADWQRRWLDGGVADAQLKYWTGRLHGAPSRLDLPTDFPRPPVRSWVGANMSVMLDLESREGLRTAARGHDATLFVGLLATIRDPALALQRAGGHSHRHPVRRTQPYRARVDGRLFHQPTRPAPGPVRRPDLQRADGAYARDRARGLRPRRRSV